MSRLWTWAFWLKLARSTRHIFAGLLVLANSVLIIRTIYHAPIDVWRLFNPQNYADINLTFFANAPYFMLGVFLALCVIGLFFRAKVAWVISLLLLVIASIYTWHYHGQWTPTLMVSLVTLVVLVWWRNDFQRSSVTAGTIFAIVSFVALLLYSAYGALYFGEGFQPKITSLMTAFYYAIETMTTVGYGDIVPVSMTARLFTMSVIVAGITVFATSASSVFGPLITGGLNRLVKGKEKKMHRENHFIIGGLSGLAVNTAKQLIARGQHVTIITNRSVDDIDESQREALDLVFGDMNDEAVLLKAGICDAQSALALGENDADNAFFILSVKEIAKDVKTVVVVNDCRNMNKLKKVQPDIVLSLQLFASDILARVLNGETIDNDMLVSLLLNSVQGIVHDLKSSDNKA